MSDCDIIVSETVVIGAGPAGLAVAACLRQAGVAPVVLEQAAQVGQSWRNHYERLHLHTSKSLSALPFVPFARDTPRYPSRAHVVDYLDAYAKRLHIEPRFGQRVVSARRIGDAWHVHTHDAHYMTASLVVASGLCRVPVVPQWPGRERFAGRVLHSSQYRSGAVFAGQRVLVVGIGNSGAEIALDLLEHGAQPSIAVRGAVNVVPREILGIPILAIGIAQNVLPARVADALNAPLMRMIYGDLAQYGLRRADAGPVAQLRDGRVPLIDVGTIAQIKLGRIAVLPGVETPDERNVRFADGSTQAFDALVLATGYRAQVADFLDAGEAVDAAGQPRASGVESAERGLYFCGFHVSPTGMLRAIAHEARHIAAAIVATGQGRAASTKT